MPTKKTTTAKAKPKAKPAAKAVAKPAAKPAAPAKAVAKVDSKALDTLKNATEITTRLISNRTKLLGEHQAQHDQELQRLRTILVALTGKWKIDGLDG